MLKAAECLLSSQKSLESQDSLPAMSLMLRVRVQSAFQIIRDILIDLV